MLSLEENRPPYQWLKTDDATNLKAIRHNLANILHPVMGRERKCTLLLLNNLAYPEWNSINCTDPALNHVVCFSRHSHNVKENSYFTNVETFCKKEWIIKDQMCYKFIWFDGTSSTLHQQSMNCGLGKGDSISILRNLFDAMYVNSLRFLLIIRSKLKKVLSYTFERIWMRTFVKKEIQEMKQSKGFIVCSDSTTKSSKDNSIFLCRNKAWISMQNVCDGIDNCKDGDTFNIPSDEQNCSCYQEYHHYKRCNVNRTGYCPPLYYKTKFGDCQVFMTTDLDGVHSNYNIQTNAFYCDNISSRSVHLSPETDLNSNCITITKNEKEYIRYLTEDLFTGCKFQRELQCIFGTSVCYNISDVCIYKLTPLGNLIPCRTGSHLADCKHFECGNKYKCPKYYCIPFGYVCDGKWDCPMGHDESIQICKNRICKHLFKCRYSHICIHFIDICDNTIDCPYADDEKLCRIRNTCPLKCHCFLFAVSCTDASVNSLALDSLPYIAINLTDVFTFSMHLLGVNDKIQVIYMSNNSLTDVCLYTSKLPGLKYIDVSKNRLNFIDTFCFKDLHQLSVILLHSNDVWFLESRAFTNLNDILLLDLTSNNITYIPKYLFYNVTRIYILMLYKNPLTHLKIDMFKHQPIRIILTTDYHMCCIVDLSSKDIECSASPPWFISCSRLFLNNFIRISFIGISIGVITLNLLSFIQKVIMSMKNTIGSTFNISVGYINIGDFCCGLYLLTIWFADLAYKDSFIIHDTKWRSHISCFLAFSLALLFSMSVPFGITFLAVARLLIVVFPFDSKFKLRPFSLKCLLLGTFIIINFITIIMLGLSKEGSIPTNLCSPFIDPTKSIIEMKVTTSIVAGIQMISLVTTICIYVLLIKFLYYTTHKNGIIYQKQASKSILFQLIMITSSNILCWVPSSLIHLSTTFLPTYSTNLLTWTTITFVPINSIINPFIFLFVSYRKTSKLI